MQELSTPLFIRDAAPSSSGLRLPHYSALPLRPPRCGGSGVQVHCDGLSRPRSIRVLHCAAPEQQSIGETSSCSHDFRTLLSALSQLLRLCAKAGGAHESLRIAHITAGEALLSSDAIVEFLSAQGLLSPSAPPARAGPEEKTVVAVQRAVQHAVRALRRIAAIIRVHDEAGTGARAHAEEPYGLSLLLQQLQLEQGLLNDVVVALLGPDSESEVFRV
jgi:hypothetical protein